MGKSRRPKGSTPAFAAMELAGEGALGDQLFLPGAGSVAE
jgi:hypothetical protein